MQEVPPNPDNPHLTGPQSPEPSTEQPVEFRTDSANGGNAPATHRAPSRSRSERLIHLLATCRSAWPTTYASC